MPRRPKEEASSMFRYTLAALALAAALMASACNSITGLDKNGQSRTRGVSSRDPQLHDSGAVLEPDPGQGGGGDDQGIVLRRAIRPRTGGNGDITPEGGDANAPH